MRKYKNKTISKRADGRWWTRYYDKTGKQHSVYGKTQEECLKNLKQALKKQTQTTKTNYTVAEWLQKWLELYKIGKVKPSTLEQMVRYSKDLGSLANKKIEKVTSIDIQEFINQIPAPRKREKIFLILKDAFNKAFKNGIIPGNLFEGVQQPKHKKKQSHALTHEEEKLFTEACRNCDQGDLYLFCLYEGLRLGEALALTYDDINFEKRTISISKSVDRDGNVTTPKTETSNRVLPLFTRAEALLNPTGTGNVFAYSRKTFQNKMAKLCKKLGFEGVTIHSLRHTFATRCAEAGVPVKVTQKWMGHSTLDMTLNVYTHINEDFERNEALKFDTYFDTCNVEKISKKQEKPT